MNIDNFDVLKTFDVNKKLVFAYLTCERLYPNYAYFSNNYGFGDKNILRDAIDFIRNNLFKSNSPENRFIVPYLESVDLNTPTPGNIGIILESSALDACCAILETLRFMIDKQASRLNDISTFATDTVDMFIVDKYNLDFNTDKEFEKKIFSHPLMQKEIAVQRGIITYLSKIQNLDETDIINLLDLQAYNGKSNIDIAI